MKPTVSCLAGSRRQFIEPPQRLERPNESPETKRRRLQYQSRKRGILESDLLCSTFAQKYLDGMSDAEMDMYDRLLDENDWDLYYWAAGERQVPDEFRDNPVLAKMQRHFRNEAKQILRMPNLNTKK